MVDIKQSLQVKQTQNLALTQQMQQSLKILQLSNMELSEYLNAELEKNPLLERSESDENQQAVDYPNDEMENNYESHASENIDAFSATNNSNTDSNILDHNQNDNWASNERDFAYNSEASNKMELLEKAYSNEKNLREHLIEQINLDLSSSSEKIIAYNLLDLLDERGFVPQHKLDEELPQICEKLNCNQSDALKTLEKLKSLDPQGVFCKDYKEFFKLQLAEQDRLDKTMEKFIDYIELLSKGELTKLKKICRVDKEEINLMIEEVKRLNINPASDFAVTDFSEKSCDLILSRKGDFWHIEINNKNIQDITLNNEYYERLKKERLNKDSKEFLKNNYNSATGLIKAVNQRASSMVRVASLIVKYQKDFFDKGVEYLKPLTLKQIAEVADLHETTIGRVVNNKFIDTPRGIFELKFFFSNAISSVYAGIEFSSESIRSKIQNIIKNEEKILSDANIADILKEENIDIARRTVSKYREELNIPTSSERKRIKKIHKN